MAKLGLAATISPIFSLLQLTPPLFQSPSPSTRQIKAAQIKKTPKPNSKPSKKKEHHLWLKRSSSGSSQKAHHLLHLISTLPNEKLSVISALDNWTAFEPQFPVIAAAKALELMRLRNQWLRIIQVSKWLLSKGQVLTMKTYDTLLLALDRDDRVEEIEELWGVVMERNTRSVSKRLFARMVSIYDRRRDFEKVLEVFGDMEELGVRPDEDTVRRVASAFVELGELEKKEMVVRKYGSKWKYLHFNGERVRVRVRVRAEES